MYRVTRRARVAVCCCVVASSPITACTSADSSDNYASSGATEAPDSGSNGGAGGTAGNAVAGNTTSGGASGTGGASGASGTGGISDAGTSGSCGSDIAALDPLSDAEANDPLAEKRSPGCGCGPSPEQAAAGTDWVRYTMSTSGTKTKAHKPDVAGPWSYEREYFVKLPADYDKNKAYPVVLQGPGCTSTGTALYGLFADLGMIRVGVTPPPSNVWNGCFDDKMGDESVEWPFYEQLFDQISNTLCIDQHRVFASGVSSGSWWSNELACIYAGDPKHPIRSIAVVTGGLPDGIESPTCRGGAFSGIWIHDADDNINPFSGTQFAVTRALSVNGCTGDFSGPREPYPVPGEPNWCEKFTGCPAAHPIVLCTAHDSLPNRGFPAGFATAAFAKFATTL